MTLRFSIGNYFETYVSLISEPAKGRGVWLLGYRGEVGVGSVFLPRRGVRCIVEINHYYRAVSSGDFLPMRSVTVGLL